MIRKRLLFIDGIVNVALGAVLLLFPLGMDRFLRLPVTSTYFYTTIFGAVLAGIGIALFVECKFPSFGLGVIGAAAINVCGASALLLLLIVCKPSLPLPGLIILVVIAATVFLLALLELLYIFKYK